MEVITIGCTSSHGGTVITGDSMVTYKGTPVARIGDKHTCPLPGHGVTSIASTPTSDISASGKMVAVAGAKSGCGATIQGCKGGISGIF